MPRIKKTPFASWETKKNDGIEKRYIRMGASQMVSEPMRALSASAFKVYCYMRLESGGKKEFTFPYQKYQSYMTKPTFSKVQRELMEKGFIDVIQRNKNVRKANVYAFSERWKTF